MASIKNQNGIYYGLFLIIIGVINNYVISASIWVNYKNPFCLVFGFTVIGFMYFRRHIIIPAILVYFHRIYTDQPSNLTNPFVILTSIIYILILYQLSLAYSDRMKIFFSDKNETLNEGGLFKIIIQSLVLSTFLTFYVIISNLLVYQHLSTIPEIAYRWSSLTYSLVLILPALILIVEKLKISNITLMPQTTPFRRDHLNIKVYGIVYVFILAITIFIQMEMSSYDLLVFLMIPLVVYSSIHGIQFSIKSNFLVGMTFSITYLIFQILFHPTFGVETILEIQYEIIFWGLISLFLGVKTDNLSLQKSKHAETQMEVLFLQKQQLAGKMAGHLAHEVNNSNQVILGNIEIIKKLETQKYLDVTDLKTAIDSYLDNITDRVAKTTKIMNDLLTISKSQMIDHKIIDIDAFITENLLKLEIVVGDNCSIIYTNSILPKIPIDENNLFQILFHLVRNSQESHSKNSCIEPIRITSDLIQIHHPQKLLFQTLPVGTYIQIIVSDCGIGIQEENLLQVFDPYFSSKENPTSGLGMSLVKSLVQLNLGYIHLNSVYGLGTEVILYFPVDPSFSQIDRNSLVDVAGTSNELITPISNIVVIDDEISLLRLFREILSNYGISTKVFENPLEFIDGLDNILSNVDMIISDVLMPGMSGIELVKLLREKGIDIPVLLMSGYTEKLDALELSDKKVEFIKKPFSPTVLISEINKLTSPTVSDEN